jgi:holo-[acyl-carrier protein] synthase
MIVGIGVDICSVERMRKALERQGERMWARICSPAERADLRDRDPALSLAGRFAAKEAFSKCVHGARGVAWHDVEIRVGSLGRPELRLKASALVRVAQFGASRWHVSLSHDAGMAVAMVVLEGTP